MLRDQRSGGGADGAGLDTEETHRPQQRLQIGVGRKTANAVLAVAFGVPGIVTDRHVIRVAHRAGLVGTLQPARVEEQLRGLLPRGEWAPFSLRGTRHGRHVCLARRPRCEQCVLNDFCPSSSTRTWPAPERLRLSLSLAARAHPQD